MITRPLLACAIAVSALLSGLDVRAQTLDNVPRVGYLGLGDRERARPFIEAFAHGLQDLGYVDGKNVVIDYRLAEGRLERLPDLAAALVRSRVQVIVAANEPAIVAARAATSTIPIVMVWAGDPVGTGLVASLSKPGGNVTGLSLEAGPEVFAKGVEFLKAAVPHGSNLGMLWSDAFYRRSPSGRRWLTVIENTARTEGALLQSAEVRGSIDLEPAIVTMATSGVRGLIVMADPAVMFPNRAQIAELAVRHRLATVAGFREYVEAGFLMSYGPNAIAQIRRAGVYVDRILKGAKPGEIPVEQPTTFELVVNMKTAKALGVTIPASIRLRADRVIE